MTGLTTICPDCGRFLHRKGPPHDCRRFRQVIELYNRPERLTLAEIGKQLHVSRERVRQIAALAGLGRHERSAQCPSCGCKAPPSHIPSECHRVEQVVKLYNDSEFHSLAEIGRQLGLSRPQVRGIARRAGLDRRPMETRTYWESLKTRCSRCGLLVTPGYHPPDVCERSGQIIALCRRSESYAAVARQIGASYKVVLKALRRAGLSPAAPSSRGLIQAR
jgi:DNA-binding CsgD family transcriptional regulator